MNFRPPNHPRSHSRSQGHAGKLGHAGSQGHTGKHGRRDFIAGVAALSFAATRCAEPPTGRLTFASARGMMRSGAGERYGLAVAGSEGRLQADIPTDFRGHGLCRRPGHPGWLVMFERRPGRRYLIAELASGHGPNAHRLGACPSDRNLQGHGCFSADGRTLFTVEADNQSAQGFLGMVDADSGLRVGELATFGIGPHEAIALADRRHLAVANGGILTRPATGREKLNLDTMRSNLTFIDTETQSRVETQELPVQKGSIRHLAALADGTIAAGLQIQREASGASESAPIAAVFRRGQAPMLLDKPVEVGEAMRGYVGSVAISPRSRLAGFTSPRGNLAAFWHVDTGDFAGYHRLADVCGLSVSPDGDLFVLSSSTGAIRFLDAFTLAEQERARRTFHNLPWDNHLVVL